MVSIAFYSSGFNSIVDAFIAFIMAISDLICLGNYVWFLDASASIYTAFVSFVYGARFENCLRPGIRAMVTKPIVPSFGLFVFFNFNHVPVSYTHLTLPTKLEV